jgi:lipopolysaccharide assembly protein A
MQIFLFFALIIAVLAVFFALQNSDPVQVKFAIWNFNSSLAFVLLLALTAGVLISVFVSLPSNIRARWTIRQQRKKLNEHEASLTETKAKLDESEKKLVALQSSPESQSGEAASMVVQDPAAKNK